MEGGNRDCLGNLGSSSAIWGDLEHRVYGPKTVTLNFGIGGKNSGIKNKALKQVFPLTKHENKSQALKIITFKENFF